MISTACELTSIAVTRKRFSWRARLCSPVPAPTLRNLGLHDPGLFLERAATVRRVVERAGGTLIDMHDVLPRFELRDQYGHLNSRGVIHAADIVEPFVREALAAGNAGSQPRR